MCLFFSNEKLLASLKEGLTYVAQALHAPMTVILWDGSRIPLGGVGVQERAGGSSDLTLTIVHQGIIASLLKNPNLENLMRHYACGNLLIEGGVDLIDFIQILREHLKKKDLKKLDKFFIIKKMWPFLLVKSLKLKLDHEYAKDETGFDDKQRNNKDFIQFHYDVSNDFCKLFLDPEMLYSCAYFKDWSNTLEQAQLDKLDMICLKLRLKKGDRLLDIGCGWGP